MGYSQTDVAERYKRGYATGTASHMFIDDGAIYSYGYHYPMVRRHNDSYLLNSRPTSISTNGQMSKVRSVLNDRPHIYLLDCYLGNVDTQIRLNNKEITALQGKIERARTDRSRETHRNRIEWLRAQNEALDRMRDE